MKRVNVQIMKDSGYADYAVRMDNNNILAETSDENGDDLCLL